MIFFDTETCGLHGPTVLIQWAEDDGPIHLHNVWRNKVDDTLKLIEYFCEKGVIGFNLAFDWFHLAQTYTTLLLLDKNNEPNINEYAAYESVARDGPCIKPAHAFDIMLHARKGPYQSTMNRKDIVVKRVPRVLAAALCRVLDEKVILKDIYFARSSNPKQRFTIQEIEDTDFVNIILRFKPSSALKTLAIDALELDSALAFKDIAPPGKPYEVGWAPFATAVSSAEKRWGVRVERHWEFAWPVHIEQHINHWEHHVDARAYAEDDVTYTRGLYKHLGSPDVDDTDSILACMVGAVRWRGFSVSLEKIKELRQLAIVKAASAPKAPNHVRKYITEVMTDAERAVIAESTKRVVLEAISEWNNDAGTRARECLDARKATKEIELYDKIIQAGRLHASFKVIGTKSARMSGADGLNPQGIKHDKVVRSAFTLAWPGLRLEGGDFDAFEVSIADAVYGDEELRKQLLSCSVCGEQFDVDLTDCPKCGGERKKIHGLFGQALSGKSYADVVASKGTEDDWYDKGKRGVFSQFYGGNENTLVTKLGVTEDVARKAQQTFAKRFKGIGTARQLIEELYSPLRQPNGIGTQVEWHEPDEYVESIYGFRRYFTLEWMICRELYNLANKLPPAWKSLNQRVVRRDREQKIGGAVMSALFAAAFNLQGQVFRAAANHVIQSPGATITKELQRVLWEHQPVGVSDWKVLPMNVHDEVMCPTCIEGLADEINAFVKSHRNKVPLLKLTWQELETWANK